MAQPPCRIELSQIHGELGETMTDDLTERVARAIFTAFISSSDELWNSPHWVHRREASYEAARAAIEAYEAVKQSARRGNYEDRHTPETGPRMAWRSIETAPKDGTDIIVYRPRHDGTYIPKVGIDWWMTQRADYGDCWAKSRKDCPPTHWMPFPESPK